MSMIPEKRFWLIRLMVKMMTVVAWLIFAFLVIATPIVSVRLMLGDRSLPLGPAESLYTAVSGIFLVVNLLFAAQSIQVILAMEENTRQSTYVLEKLATLTQQIRDRLPENAEDRDSGSRGPA
jgi:hypothetical protein